MTVMPCAWASVRLDYRGILARTRVALSLVVLLTASANAMAKASNESLAIVGVRVFTAPDKAVIENGVVLVRHGRIARVGSRRSVSIPSNYRVLEFRNGSVTAGFWNSHVHLTRPVFLASRKASDAQLQTELDADFTRWGFTTVFDLASTTEVANELKGRLRNRRIRGTRILSVGEPFYPSAATPVYARPLYEAYGLPSAEVISPSQASMRVHHQIGSGADGIKLFAGSIVGGPQEVVHMDVASVKSITSAAHRLGKRVFAHPTDRAGLEVAISNGVDVLAHSAPLMGAWTRDFARTIALRRVALIPTLALFEDAANASTPVSVAIQQTRMLANVGGAVLFGTDAGFTDLFDTSSEMRLMAQALGWKRLVAALTTAPANFFGETRQRGRVRAGMTADLVVLDGDPSAEIKAFSKVLLVLRSGEIVFEHSR